jgi:peptide/nickel transport system ATP-binding protein
LRARATEADLLVCDEPTSALDVSVQAQILNLMRRLQDEFGLTYLFISHNLAVVRHMSDEIAIMHLGCFVETGPAEEVFRAPRHPYTRLLLETIPMSASRAANVGSCPAKCRARSRRRRAVPFIRAARPPPRSAAA